MAICMLMQGVIGALAQDGFHLEIGVNDCKSNVPGSSVLRHVVVSDLMIGPTQLFHKSSCGELPKDETHACDAFARHFITSAAPFGDCDFESGLASMWIFRRRDESTWTSWRKGFRYGEARHPGPQAHDEQHGGLLRIGLSNPTGIRKKEPQLIELGPGVWNYAETHLTEATKRTSSYVLKKLARSQNRDIRFVTGAAVEVRSNSTWAGNWSGVAQLSDLPTVPISIGWQPDHWQSSRVLVTRQWASNLPITVCTFYGFPSSPTWPMAKRLLETFTREIVLGTSGVRVIAGDYNAPPESLSHQKIWRQHGWVNAQTHAIQHLGHTWQPTFKQSTEPDQVWLSPEAAALLRGLEIKQVFAEHATVMSNWKCRSLPSKFSNGHFRVNSLGTPLKLRATSRFSIMGQMCLLELITLANGQLVLKGTLKNNYKGKGFRRMKMMGRGQRVEPTVMDETMPISRASRNGEIQLQNDLIGTAVKLHFQQARRLQSLQHALRAGKMTWQAVEYRLSLWTSIRRAKGFQSSFAAWWQSQSKKYEDSPTLLPETVPNLDMIELIYQEFLAHFRDMERWHTLQRTNLLKEKYKMNMRQLFRELKPQAKNTPDVFAEHKHFEVIEADSEQGLICLEPSPEHHEGDHWTHEGANVQILGYDGAICRVSPGTEIDIGDTLVQHIFHSTVQQVQTQLVDFWKPRWQRCADIPPDQWQRIVAFVDAYFPTFELQLDPISLTDWRATIIHMKQRAARGLDGFSRDDMKWMDQSHTEWLLHRLNAIELGEQDWPQQLLHATVVWLEKYAGACQPAGFRPITIFSVIYRLWSSLRTRQMLALMRRVLPDGIHGFVPGAETTEIWLQVQGQIELARQEKEVLFGMSADLQKAFNHIGRKQTSLLAAKVGVSQRIMVPWGKFISSCRGDLM